MTPAQINRDAITPALSLLPARMDSAEARCMLLAIGLQESRFLYRRQMNMGPAMGFWQFEKGGGVRGVLNHPASRQLAQDVCYARDCPPEVQALWERLETDDVLAACIARLLLWTDAKPLPAFDDVNESWGLYKRVWRPGRPHPETWSGFHQQAQDALA